MDDTAALPVDCQGMALDEDTLRRRAELWRLRALASLDPKTQAANLMLAEHYEAMADALVQRSKPPAG
ncbi:hypothetical protein BH10PSE1_BH10PSE1_35600 [soil metagenome]